MGEIAGKTRSASIVELKDWQEGLLISNVQKSACVSIFSFFSSYISQACGYKPTGKKDAQQRSRGHQESGQVLPYLGERRKYTSKIFSRYRL